MNIVIALSLFSGISMILYGLSCLLSQFMKEEFERYQLPQFRILIGSLEILGGLGLIVGLYEPILGLISATGLSVLLLCGVLVRVKIRDGIVESTPALFYFLLNLFLALDFFTFLR